MVVNWIGYGLHRGVILFALGVALMKNVYVLLCPKLLSITVN